ncbi:MAG: glycosyltransferase family 39 protein [Candidatus Krumholzibacteriia bacterium]
MRRDPVLAIVLVAFTILVVWAGAPEIIDYDSAQFALALEQHDMRLHQPHPPGFVLYAWIAEFVHAFVGDAYASLRIVAVLMLLAAAVIVHRLASAAYDGSTARLTTLLLLSSPLVLFHGLTTMTYPAEALAAALSGYLCFRAQDKGTPDLKFVAFLVGLLGGLRQTVLVFTLPLLILTVRRAGLGYRGVALTALAWLLGVLAWLVPQIEHAGGPGSYFQANLTLQTHVFATSPLQKGWPSLQVHLHRGVTVLVLGLGGARLLALLGGALFRAWPRRADPPGLGGAAGPRGLDGRFFLAWMLPPVLLFAFYHFPKSGYALALWPGVCIAVAHFVRRRFTSPRGTLPVGAGALLGIVGLLDLVIFFVVPATRLQGMAPGVAARSHFEEAADPRRDGSASFWSRLQEAPPAVLRTAQIVFGRVDFFFDRTRGFAFGGMAESLRKAGFPRDDTLLLGQDATRALCQLLPMQLVIHADPLRPYPFLRYRGRRAEQIEEPFEVPDGIRWLLVEGNRGSMRFARDADLPEHQEALPPALRRRFHLFEIGERRLDAWFVPRAVEGSDPIRLRLVRDARPEDPVEANTTQSLRASRRTR